MSPISHKQSTGNSVLNLKVVGRTSPHLRSSTLLSTANLSQSRCNTPSPSSSNVNLTFSQSNKLTPKYFTPPYNIEKLSQLTRTELQKMVIWYRRAILFATNNIQVGKLINKHRHILSEQQKYDDIKRLQPSILKEVKKVGFDIFFRNQETHLEILKKDQAKVQSELNSFRFQKIPPYSIENLSQLKTTELQNMLVWYNVAISEAKENIQIEQLLNELPITSDEEKYAGLEMLNLSLSKEIKKVGLDTFFRNQHNNLKVYIAAQNKVCDALSASKAQLRGTSARIN